jgi:hypothetical protein
MKGTMMTMAFKDNKDCLFNDEMVLALNKGETLQIKGGWGSNAKEWRDWKVERDSHFGPWYYNKIYEWRVKPDTVEFEIEREVKTVVKTKVEIPAPFKGMIPKDSQYSRLFKESGEWYVYHDHFNFTPTMGQSHVEKDLVYLDKDTAQKAFDILTKG